MIKVCASDLRWPVEVQRPTHQDDGYGGKETVWNKVGVIWCKVVEKSAKEYFANQQHIRVEARIEFITRYGADVVETDRLYFEDKYHNIRRVEDIERRRKFLRIAADMGAMD